MSENKTEISLNEIVRGVRNLFNYLLTKWLIICVFGFSGALIGLGASFVVKTEYTASLSFALIEKTSGGGGLADLASSFGFGGLLGSGANGAFSGDNLLEILKSRHTIESTLLTPVDYNGNKKNLADIYIDFNRLREKWVKNKKNPQLKSVKFPIGQKRETFSRIQDSVLFVIFDQINKSQSLRINRKDKKLSFVSVEFTSKDELFSKLFVETLMDETYKFYKETKTSQSRYNIDMMQHKADSVKALYESAMYKGASFSSVNINPALQIAMVPRLKQESDAKLYGTVYSEILKNLETLKLDLARETPIVQIIDEPILPLEKIELSKLKGIFLGGILGGLIIVIYLFSAFIIRKL